MKIAYSRGGMRHAADWTYLCSIFNLSLFPAFIPLPPFKLEVQTAFTDFFLGETEVRKSKSILSGA